MIQYFLSYIWEMIWHLGFGFGLMICGGLWAWFMPVGKKIGLLVAILAGWGIISYAIGVADERRHWKAAEQRTLVSEDAARAKAELSVEHPSSWGVRHDRFDRDK